jgi:hypothetical protein
MTTRALGRFVCRLLIGVLVTTQVAIAAYACAGMPGIAQVADAASVGSQDMAMAADGMDPGLSNLCVGHCRFEHQTADKKPAPDVPLALLTSLYALPALDHDAGVIGPLVPRGLSAAPDPPHAILHCCLRD